jgi:CheY-like chemotaxis protein
MGKRIIIADKDKMFLSTVAARLVAASHEVVSVTDMPRAIEAVRERLPDLILCSLDLPGGGAIQLQECLQDASRRSQRTNQGAIQHRRSYKAT